MTQQPLPLREQMKSLEGLQEIDLKIDQLKRQKDSLPAELKALDDNFKKVRQSLDSKALAVTEIEKNQRQARAAVDLNNDRLKRASSKLEAVANSNEFQAANKEIEQLKRLNTTLEEQLKKLDADLITEKLNLVTLNEQFTSLEGERDSQFKKLEGRGTQLGSDINSLSSERRQFLDRVEKRIVSIYERIRVGRQGLGLVPAIGGRCKGCNMMVPPQLYNQVQRSQDVQSCPSCHRILYIPQE